MELGATLCTPKSPQCLLCPVAQFCQGRKLGIAESLPEKRKQRATVEVTLAAAVFSDANGLTLLLPPSQEENKQDAADHIPTLVSRMWHFPTVSVTKNPAAELHRFLQDFLSAGKHAKLQLEPLGKVRHSVTYRAITIAPFLVNFKQLPRVPNAKRVPLREISSLPVSNLTRKVARAALAAAIPLAKKR
jgi:A/G-specific adenine glycosylase